MSFRPQRFLLQLSVYTVAVAVATAGLLAVSTAGGSGPISVTVISGGTPRTLMVDPPASVASVLATADVVPRPGRLVSIATHRVLDETNAKPQLWLGGQMVDPSTPVGAGASLNVVEAPDEVEATVEVGASVPPPPLPDVINELWRPGLPGLGTSAKGVRSGELVTRTTTTPPVPPARMLDKEIALTFDDGPWSTTPAVLAVLREKQVKAMFCMVGYTLNPGGVAHAKEVVADGHPICNHTIHHDEKLAKKPQPVIDAEILGGNDLLTDRVGIPKPTFYRPPGGSLGPGVIATAKSQGQTVVMWTIDPKDYKKPPAAEIVNRVISGLRPGAIILLHDGGGDRSQTVAAVGPIIDQARALGYTFVTPDAVKPVQPVAPPAPIVTPPAPLPGPLEPGG